MQETTIQQPIAIKKVAKKQLVVNLARSRWSLPVILLLQAAVSLLALQNTAFQDEALYLYAGRQIFNSWFGGPHVIDPYAAYFSGYPAFYPVIGGMLDMLGGLELARMFSLVCMLGVTTCAYFATKNLFDRDSAIFAAAIFAGQAPVLFMGHLATYDALCLLLLATALVLALHVSKADRPWGALGLGPLLVLAVVAKYAGLLFVPTVLVLLTWCSLERQGWLKMFARVALMGCSLAVTAVVAYLLMDKAVLVGISATTTNRVPSVYTAPQVLLTHIIWLGGIAFLLSLLGIVCGGWKRLPLGLILFGSALLAPAYHLYKGELVSLDKHMGFSMFFLMPLVGYAVAYLSGYQQSIFKGRYWLTGLAICLVIFSIGIQQAQYLYTEWAPSTNVEYVLRTQVRDASGRYLAEDYDVSRYYLQDVTAPWQWSSLDFFEYTNQAKQQLSGPAAYAAAIHDGYFNLVELSYGYNAALAVVISSDLKASKQYNLIARIPYHNAYGNGYYWIWRKHVPKN